MSRYRKFDLSVTIHTDDRKLSGLLSALAWVCEPQNPRQIHIEGQPGGNWDQNGHQVKFHFSREAYRGRFICTAKKLYRNYPQSWEVTDKKDNDPPKVSN
jgi:hypothetical protein